MIIMYLLSRRRAPGRGAGVVCEMLPSMGQPWVLHTGPRAGKPHCGLMLCNVASSANEAVLGQ